MYAMSLTLASTQISVCRGYLEDRLEQPIDRKLHVAFVVGKRRIASTLPPPEPVAAVKRWQVGGYELEAPAHVLIDSGPAYHTVAHRVPFFDSKKFTGGERWVVRAVGEFVAFGRY